MGLVDLGQLIMSEGKEEPVFASYKGLGYVSMFMGVPLTPLLIISGAALFGAFVIGFFFGWPAIIWVVFCGLLVFALKILCETDNKAMERFEWSIRALRLRFSKASVILTVSPNKTGSKYERVLSRLKKIHRAG